MRLYHLRLQAIGPFAGVHEIDFAALGRSGLFLLEGPTGAGKSTIIDAIVFALYGQLAGESASRERLHSHHAPEGLEPYVDLVFEVESGIYRVRRSPAHQRAKRRGEGTTTQNETVTLTRLHDVDAPDAGEVVSTRAQEVGPEITRLIGLQREQFLQTVVLPQGEFARFLRSSGEERKKLLETIFRTDVYERITLALIERRKEAYARTRDARQAVDVATQVLARAGGVEPVTLLDADGVLEVPACEALVEAASSASAAAAEAAEAARARLAEATAVVSAAEALTAALARRTDLLARQQGLRDDDEAVAAAGERMRSARRAALVQQAIADAAGAAQRREAAAAAHERAATDLAPEQPLTAEECGSLDHELSERLAELSLFTKLEHGFVARETQLAGLRRDLDAAEAEVVAAESRIAERPARRAEIVAGLGTSREAADALPAAQAAVDQAQRVLTAARGVEGHDGRLGVAHEALEAAAGAASVAVRHHADLRLRRIHGMAGELAMALVPGEPCAVCGAVEHPRPAIQADDHPHEDAIAAAESAAASAERVADDARAQVVRLDAERAALLEQAAGLSVDDATTALTTLVADRDAAAEAAARRDELQAALDTFDTGAADDARHRQECGDTAVALRTEVAGLQRELDDDRSAVERALDGADGTLADLTARVGAHRDRVRAYARTSASLTLADQQLSDTTETVDRRLAEQQFDDRDAALAAVLPADEIDRLDRLVTEHGQQTRVVAEGLAAPEIAVLTGHEEPDLPAARQRHEAAAADHEACAGAAATAAHRRDEVTSRWAALETANGDLAEAAADAAAVIRVADVAEGSAAANLKKLTLGTYVLMRRFEDVVAAANSRLGPMSSGRYQLRATDERERSGRSTKTGLSLAVIDTETGQEREPRTLSGGETFYASLCLALGLADVVMAEAGGVELGTLFVDEGFGSLDPATLDDVMAELTGLARGGRVVGIVSHVEDLKQRVADRIEIRRRDDGSSTLSVLV